ncbi:MAG: hypothetical protein Q4C01_01065 [Clostridia bacterium]|nr:hypothetical protein [Clostridia bacterium]
MATYKQPCMHCDKLIDSASGFCPFCGRQQPFGYACPKCRKPIEKGQLRCSGCGRELHTLCPYCEQPTFVQDICERCGQSLMKRCANKRCGALQFFENEKCTSCGKKLKKLKIKR